MQTVYHQLLALVIKCSVLEHTSLPAHLRSTLTGHRQFRDGLKSYLFADAYF